METIEQIYKGQELVKRTKSIFSDVKKHIIEKKWRINIDLDNVDISEHKILNFSWNRTKKFNKVLRKLDKKKSIKSLNSAFHYIFKRTLETDNPVRIKISSKEEDIQNKRKSWLKARNIADQLLLEYKEEKGDFYKS